MAFMRASVAVLRSSPPPAPVKVRRALEVAEKVLSVPVANRPNRTLPRLAEEIAERSGVRLTRSRLSVVLRKKGDCRWRRPRHTLKGAQDADAVDRSGLRRKLLKAQAEVGGIVLLFDDESEALTHPDLAHVWAKRGADPRVPALGRAAQVAMLGVLDWTRCESTVHTSRTKRSADFIALLEAVDRLYGPKPGAAGKPIVLVLDNGPTHTSKATLAARAQWLPKYAPELNDTETVWRDLKRHHLAQQTSAGANDLDRAIHKVVVKLNLERRHRPLISPRIAA